MKLQLTPQALRLRLAEEEIQEFARAGQLSHTLPLAGGPGLTYALRRLPADAPQALGARYEAGVLVVEVPAMLAQQLAQGTAVSLKRDAEGTDSQRLRILVEKDLGPSH